MGKLGTKARKAAVDPHTALMMKLQQAVNYHYVKRRAAVHEPDSDSSDSDDEEQKLQKVQLKRVQSEAVESMQVLSARGAPSSRPGSRPLSRQGSGIPAALVPGSQGSLGAAGDGRSFRIMAHQPVAAAAGKDAASANSSRASTASGVVVAAPLPVALSRLARTSAAAAAVPDGAGLHANPLFQQGGNVEPSWVQELEYTHHQQMAAAIERARQQEGAVHAAQAEAHAAELRALLDELQAAKKQLEKAHTIAPAATTRAPKNVPLPNDAAHDATSIAGAVAVSPLADRGEQPGRSWQLRAGGGTEQVRRRRRNHSTKTAVAAGPRREEAAAGALGEEDMPATSGLEARAGGSSKNPVLEKQAGVDTDSKETKRSFWKRLLS